jgi:hypothetical protein
VLLAALATAVWPIAVPSNPVATELEPIATLFPPVASAFKPQAMRALEPPETAPVLLVSSRQS